MNVLKTYPYFITTENDRNMFFIYLYVDDLITLEMIVIFQKLKRSRMVEFDMPDLEKLYYYYYYYFLSLKWFSLLLEFLFLKTIMYKKF